MLTNICLKNILKNLKSKLKIKPKYLLVSREVRSNSNGKPQRLIIRSQIKYLLSNLGKYFSLT